MEIENELTEEVVEHFKKSGEEVNRRTIKRVRIHLLQKYNTDQKRNTQATDAHFAVVQNWVREFLVEWEECVNYFKGRVDDADDADDASRRGESESNKRALPLGLRASATLMDGAGSGFSACLAMDRRMLAVGTKTGAVQVLDFLDFRRHAA